MAEAKKPPLLKIRVLDKKDGEIANVETDVVSLVDHPAFQEERFNSILDALMAFYNANPSLKRIDVEVIGED